MINFFLEKLRQLFASEPDNIFSKIKVFVTDNKWNLFDVIAIVMFLVAFNMRVIEVQQIKYSRVIYVSTITYWYIRSLKLIGVNKYFGPYVMMIGKMK